MAFAPDPFTTELTTSGGATTAPSWRRAVELVLGGLIGEGAINLLRARAEVHAALAMGGGTFLPAPALPDAARPEDIPSVAAGWQEDRVLAEVDQDGFAFACDPLDEPFFNRRSRRLPRQHNRIDIVLADGHVCIRKQISPLRMGARLWGARRISASAWARHNLWVALGLFMYSEAAALLRLRDLPFVPKLRGIDLRARTLYLDYIRGEDLRREAAHSGAPVHDSEVNADDELRLLPPSELWRREVELLDRAGGGNFRREISEMAREMNGRGVVPLDIKLGNLVRGAASRQLYWLDFEFCRLESQPRWEEDLVVQQDILQTLFRLGGPCDAPSVPPDIKPAACPRDDSTAASSAAAHPAPLEDAERVEPSRAISPA